MANLFDFELPSGTKYLKFAITKELQLAIIEDTRLIAKESPFRRAKTRSGLSYSTKMTSCGEVGWTNNKNSYEYTIIDPLTNRPWPELPRSFASCIEYISGAEAFEPDTCLINYYDADAKMGLHQDRDEKSFSAPIIIVSLGNTADFLLGGLQRSDKPQTILLESGDIIAFENESRLRFHGIRKTYPGTSPFPNLNGRLSLTFRKAL
jgi:alkylated DNA repair protein (DNA oxidative demethylase)